METRPAHSPAATSGNTGPHGLGAPLISNLPDPFVELLEIDYDVCHPESADLTLQKTQNAGALYTYNTMLKLVPENRTANQQQTHIQIQNSCARIRNLLAQYWTELVNLEAAVHSGISSASTLIGSAPHWYDSVNILSLTFDLVKKLVEEQPIQDATHFQEYLVDILPAYLLSNGMSGESERSDRERMLDLKRKLMVLHDSLMRSNDPLSHQLSLILCATWSAQLCDDCDLLVRYDYGDEDDPWRELRMRAQWNLSARPRTRRGGQPCSHWKTAAARRLLLHTYTQMPCSPPLGPLDPANPRCYHLDIQPLLDRMWNDAFWEISTCVRTATSHALPAELADAIFEYALEAEGLTAEDRFRHYDSKSQTTIDTPEHLICPVMRHSRKPRPAPERDIFYYWDEVDDYNEMVRLSERYQPMEEYDELEFHATH